MSDKVNESDDDDFGPKPVSAEAEEEASQPKRKKARSLEFEKLYLDHLPSADFYEHSYMHRDVVTSIAVSKSTEFIITASLDGHVKFWKKMSKNIEFVKHYQAHLGPVHALVLSSDEKLLVTTSADQMIKFFEIIGFDMCNMIRVSYIPNCAAWLCGPSKICDRVAVSDMNSGLIRIYKADGEDTAIKELTIHASPIRLVSED